MSETYLAPFKLETFLLYELQSIVSQLQLQQQLQIFDRMNTIKEDYHLLLPDEITTEILSRLPTESVTESVMQCKLVCKTWRALIVDPNFIYVYTHHYSLNTTTELEWVSLPGNIGSSNLQVVKYYNIDDSGRDDHDKNPIKQTKPIMYYPRWLLGTKKNSSCNGLIFMTTLTNQIFVCNPFTREYVDLPRISFNNRRLPWSMAMATGFGYHSSTNEYKVIIIYYCSKSKGQLTIYTLGNGGWRDKGEISHRVIDGATGGVLFNGRLHWLTEKKDEIVSFDLADEEFRIVPSPPSQSPSYNLGLLGGCLYVTRIGIEDSFGIPSTTEIWVMDSMEYSWSKKFNIPWNERPTRPLALLESGKILLHRSGERLISYDPETKSSVFVGKSEFRKVFTYTKTIVSLKALGETDATIFDSDASIFYPDYSDLINKRKRNSDNP